jgi:uncharacterized membrane protein YhaH (DUF805 family)
MTDEKFLRLWGKARRRGYWVYTLTRLLITCLCFAVPYVGASWFLNEPINLLPPAIVIGTVAIVQLALGPSVWRSREEKYRQLMSSTEAFD